ncbi:MAG: type II secretion system F family protein [Methanosarcinaceae archaeon]|nr:type II secretion system F family protein [Methanosarcinaceae archaeon]
MVAKDETQMQSSGEVRLSESQLRELEDHLIALGLEKIKVNVKLKQFLKNPYEYLYSNPSYIVFFSFPLALIFFIIGMKFTWGTALIDDVIIFTVLITITPPAMLHYKKRRIIKKIEEYMPNFLRDIGEMSRAGLTLPRAVATVAKGEYGDLSKEVKLMNASMSWGISFEETLENFAARMNTPLITRSVALITQANRAGGRVSSVLEAAARDASEIKLLQRERSGNMIVYLVIIYMAFFVFIFVILMLTATFIPTMAQAGNAASAAGAGSQFLGAFDPDKFTRILFHAAVIQGFVSGLVAGQLGEGEFFAGLKHSVILTLTAWIAFTFFV